MKEGRGRGNFLDGINMIKRIGEGSFFDRINKIYKMEKTREGGFFEVTPAECSFWGGH